MSQSRIVSGGQVVSQWVHGAQVAEDQKQTYQDKLEKASHDDVFKYVFLINNASVEKYVQQSREQAETAFLLSKRVAIAGFALLAAGIVIGLISQFTDQALTTAYLAGIGGVLTEFIAGVFFWMYNRTLQQINLFYQGLMMQQQDALAAIGRVSESGKEADKGRLLAELVKADAPPNAPSE
jgi:hypothetical protein